MATAKDVRERAAELSRVSGLPLEVQKFGDLYTALSDGLWVFDACSPREAIGKLEACLMFTRAISRKGEGR